MITLKKLTAGDNIVIIAPSKWIDEKSLVYAIKVLESWSLNIILSPHLYGRNHYFSGTDEERKIDLQWAIDHTDIKAIFCARGGYGVTRFIDKIDFTTLNKFPKWIIGFSDITALHLKLTQLNCPSLHANMPALFENYATKRSLLSIKEYLFSNSINYQWEFLNTTENYKNRVGQCKGVLIGGNLAIICHCLDTLTANDFKDKILFIEEVGEKYYAIDRFIVQLIRTKKLYQIKGILVGAFSECEDHKQFPFDYKPLESIYYHFSILNIPIAFHFPAGHIADNCALPMGVPLHLTVGEKLSTLVSVQNNIQ